MKSVQMIFYGFIAGILLGMSGNSCAAGAAVIAGDDVISEFIAGGVAYKAEDYDKAIAAYEEILKGGKESGALYYNLGNSYFKKGNVGKAILNYERARRLIPRDSDLNFNLQYVRSRANVSGEPTGLPWGRQLVEQLTRHWTDRELAWALFSLAFVLGALQLFSLYARLSPRARNLTLAVVATLCLICAGGLWFKLATEKNQAVAVAATEAKFEPRGDATTHFSVGEGTLLKIFKTEDGWAKVARPDGKMGWIPEKTLERVENQRGE